MSDDEYERLSKLVEQAKTLKGEITMLKQTVGWLESNAPMIITLDIAQLRTVSMGAHPVKLVVDENLEKHFRVELHLAARLKLGKKLRKLDDLTTDITNIAPEAEE